MSKTKIFLNLSIYWVLVIRLGLVFCCCRRQRNKKDVDLTSFLFIFFIFYRMATLRSIAPYDTSYWSSYTTPRNYYKLTCHFFLWWTYFYNPCDFAHSGIQSPSHFLRRHVHNWGTDTLYIFPNADSQYAGPTRV